MFGEARGGTKTCGQEESGASRQEAATLLATCSCQHSCAEFFKHLWPDGFLKVSMSSRKVLASRCVVGEFCEAAVVSNVSGQLDAWPLDGNPILLISRVTA